MRVAVFLLALAAGAVAAAVLAGLVTRAALAAPPPDADPALAPWFQGLQSPSGASCCSLADCRPVDSRVKDGHYEALTEAGWIAIPADKIIHPKSNPVGRAVLCASPAQPDLIFCFAPPLEVRLMPSGGNLVGDAGSDFQGIGARPRQAARRSDTRS